MKTLSMVLLLTTALAIACSTQSNKKTPGETQLTITNKNIVTKTNITSSDAKADDRSDSAVLIRPIHKHEHYIKYKIK